MDPFNSQMNIYRNRVISKYLVPQQNFINLLQEKLPSSLTGVNDDEQVCCYILLFHRDEREAKLLEEIVE